MRHLSSIVLAVALIAAGATACFKDPTSSLRNGPSRIELTRSTMFLNIGDSLSVQAVVKDDQGMTYGADDATWTSSAVAVAVVRKETSVTIPYSAFSKAFVRAVSAGSSWVKVESHGITDSLRVFGLPLSFTGTVAAPANPTTWDTITVNSTAALTFSTAAATPSVVTIGLSNSPTYLVSRTATAIKVVPLASASAGAVIHISNVMLSGIVRIPTLNAATALTNGVTVVNEPGNNALATATVISIPAAATAADPFQLYGILTSAAVNDYYTFTLAAPAVLDAVLAWFGDGSGSDTGNPDLDLLICGPAPATCGYANDLFPGNAASTAGQPESGTTASLAAGTYVLRVWGYVMPASMNYRLKLNLQ